MLSKLTAACLALGRPPVHDSVLFEVPVALVEETREIVQYAMETLPEGFTVPLKFDIYTGRTWADCK